MRRKEPKGFSFTFTLCIHMVRKLKVSRKVDIRTVDILYTKTKERKKEHMIEIQSFLQYPFVFFSSYVYSKVWRRIRVDRKLKFESGFWSNMTFSFQCFELF